MGKDNAPKPPAAKARHYIRSWVNSKALPSTWAFKKVRQDLSFLREELINQYGGEKVSPQALILVDSIVEALGVQKLQGLYIRKAGIMRQDSLKAGNLELHSILAKSWISYANVVRQGLMALRELGTLSDAESTMTPAEIARAVDIEMAGAEVKDAENRARIASTGRSADERTAGGGKSGDQADPSSHLVDDARPVQLGDSPSSKGDVDGEGSDE